MRKYLIFLILLCLHVMARGQTIPTLDDLDLPQSTKAKSLQYWFDDDIGSMKTSPQLAGKLTVDASSLQMGVHTLHYQIIDTDNKLTPAKSSIFIKFDDSSTIAIQSLRYWFDNDDSAIKTSTAFSGNQILDASMLDDGLHTVHYQVMGNDGHVYHIASGFFMKLKETTALTASKMIYWYDEETDYRETAIANGVQLIDASGLTEGTHVIHYSIICNDGSTTPVNSAAFVKQEVSIETVTATALRYWFDDDANIIETPITTGVQLLETSSLLDGMHTLHYTALCSDGTTTPVASSVFFKANYEDINTTAKSLRYWFDDETDMTTTAVTNGVQKIDVSRLIIGLHTVHYQIVDSKDRVCSAESRVFFKDFAAAVGSGENRIIKYDYWINNDTQSKETVTLSDASNPYQLITLLPMKTAPIRSSNFHFEMTDGKPTIYAKNDFYIRFYDARDYFDYGHKQFVDYHVKQEVTEITLLESGNPREFSAPAENTIKWFKVTAQRGDSLSFRVSNACSMQLFSPSGEELYNAEGYTALSYGGAHAPQDGTYYLALHDAASQSGSLLVEYQHIDKYALLSYSPHSIGVSTSYFDVKLEGNGYDKLKNATLKMGTKTIESKSISAQSKGSAVLCFPIIGDEPTGNYSLILGFQDGNEEESLTVEDAIAFGDPDDREIEVVVKQSEIAKMPYIVTVSVTNKSNVSKNWIPFNVASTFDSKEYNSTVMVEESAWNSMYTMNFDVLDPLSEGSSRGNEDSEYSSYTFTDNLFGDGIPGLVLNGFIPTLGPNETKDYILGFVGDKAHAKFNLYAWTGVPLNEGYLDANAETNIYSAWKYLMKFQETSNTRTIVPPPNYDGINNVLDAADHFNGNAARAARTAVGIGLVGGGIINGLRLRNIQAYTQNDPFAAEVLHDYEASLRNNMPTPAQIAEISGHDRLARLMGLRERQATNNNPRPRPHRIDIYLPGDPNDIHGYTSESGSNYITKEVTDVSYTIEFENDPEIANAAAHTIVVKDTLDVSRFDMSTFRAQSIKLGNKVTYLNGEKSFSNMTIDLRPAVNVVAQVSLSLDEQKGIATWTIESLDPLSLEPTLYAYQGVLPVNTNGDGQGEVSFDIKLKPGMSDGDELHNRAGIVFDDQPTIMTPTWTNIVDGVLPVSSITEVVKMDGTNKAKVSVSITDSRSQPWKYDVYMQQGTDGEWKKAAANVPDDTSAEIPVKGGGNYGFYVVSTDMAGNVEQKTAAREKSLITEGTMPGDVNGDGKITIADAVAIISYINGQNPKDFDESAADINEDGHITVADAVKVLDSILKGN